MAAVLTGAGTPHQIVDPDPETLPHAIAVARVALGGIRGVIHLAGCHPPADWPLATTMATTALYRAISLCLPDLTDAPDGQAPARIFALTRMGGLGGRSLMGGQPPPIWPAQPRAAFRVCSILSRWNIPI